MTAKDRSYGGSDSEGGSDMCGKSFYGQMQYTAFGLLFVHNRKIMYFMF